MGENITKSDIILSASTYTGLPRYQIKEIVNALLNNIEFELKGGKKITLLGFGCFHTVLRKEKKGINPQTGKTMLIPEKTAAKFRPSKTLKEALNIN